MYMCSAILFVALTWSLNYFFLHFIFRPQGAEEGTQSKLTAFFAVSYSMSGPCHNTRSSNGVSKYSYRIVELTPSLLAVRGSYTTQSFKWNQSFRNKLRLQIPSLDWNFDGWYVAHQPLRENRDFVFQAHRCTVTQWRPVSRPQASRPPALDLEMGTRKVR